MAAGRTWDVVTGSFKVQTPYSDWPMNNSSISRLHPSMLTTKHGTYRGSTPISLPTSTCQHHDDDSATLLRHLHIQKQLSIPPVHGGDDGRLTSATWNFAQASSLISVTRCREFAREKFGERWRRNYCWWVGHMEFPMVVSATAMNRVGSGGRGKVR